MKIKSVELKNYRNYSNSRFDFIDGINLLIGENGRGKTNLIESLYICSIGKSFRTNKIKDCVMFEKDYSNINLLFEKDDDEIKIEFIISSEGKKAININKVKVKKSSELISNLVTVVFSPEDLKIVKEDPIKRRQFIDREISLITLKYIETLKNYNQTLIQRNAILKEDNVNISYLSIWDEQFAKYGSLLVGYRKNFIEKLSLISQEKHASITNGKEKLELAYRPNVDGELLEAITGAHDKDIRNRITSCGPHKDDFEIIINGKNARYFASQGQQRTAALSLKLAEMQIIENEIGEKPILLLDDVLSEIDRERQIFLINSFSDVQMFITATEIEENILKQIEKENKYKLISI